MNELSPPTLHPALRSLIRGFLIAMLLVGSNIAANILWEMYNPVPRLVTVDINSIARTFIAETAKSDMSDEDKRSQTEAFANQIDDALQGLAARQGSIILTTPAVIAGAEDITEAVKKGLVK